MSQAQTEIVLIAEYLQGQEDGATDLEIAHALRLDYKRVGQRRAVLRKMGVLGRAESREGSDGRKRPVWLWIPQEERAELAAGDDSGGAQDDDEEEGDPVVLGDTPAVWAPRPDNDISWEACDPPWRDESQPAVFDLPGNNDLAAKGTQLILTQEWLLRYTVRGNRSKLAQAEVVSILRRMGEVREGVGRLFDDIANYMAANRTGAVGVMEATNQTGGA